MKKSFLYLATFSSLFYFLHFDATTAFLTSEKQQLSPMSTGTNEDVFKTETTDLTLNTQVTKRIKITRSKGKSASGGAQKDQRSVKISYTKGARTISFIPQRPDLDLSLENLTITGDAAGELIIQKIETDEDVPTFRISHDERAIEAKNGTVTGELHVSALGGFYDMRIPIKIVTHYNESTKVTETPTTPPGPPPPPDPPPPVTPTPDTPSPDPPPPATPTPDTPPPVTPTPDTPTPDTPPPVTPTPDTPTPDTPPPVTPTPDPPPPDTPTPDTPPPVTPTPDTPPVSSVPGTTDANSFNRGPHAANDIPVLTYQKYDRLSSFSMRLFPPEEGS